MNIWRINVNKYIFNGSWVITLFTKSERLMNEYYQMNTTYQQVLHLHKPVSDKII